MVKTITAAQCLSTNLLDTAKQILSRDHSHLPSTSHAPMHMYNNRSKTSPTRRGVGWGEWKGVRVSPGAQVELGGGGVSMEGVAVVISPEVNQNFLKFRTGRSFLYTFHDFQYTMSWKTSGHV